ncbi:MAG: glycosyltransferase [Chloroflexota bacterium]
MTFHTPLCSIVIRAYNEEQHLGKLLEGLRQQSLSNTEVILVDSGSTDQTPHIGRRYGAKVLQISPQDFTFGRSLNLGISHAQADVVVIASAHVYPVYPDWLERLLSPFQDPQTALAYGKQRGAANSKYAERQIFQQWYPDQSNPRQTHPFCNNANAAIRRSLWEQHPYDETLSGLEDLAWAKWATEAGYHLAYVAEAEVIHVHQETPRAVYNRYRREAMAFKRIFPQEQFGVRDLLRLAFSNIASDIWHAGREKELIIHFGEIIWFRWMQFWGTYQGYRQSGPLTWQLRQTFYYPRQIKTKAVVKPRNVQPIQYKD